MQKLIWQKVIKTLLKDLESDESISLSLSAEDSTFIRFNQAKVRQGSEITQASAEIILIKNNRQIKLNFPICFHEETDLTKCRQALKKCRHEINFVPEDPYIQWPMSAENSYQKMTNKVNRSIIIQECLEEIQGYDFVGLLTIGEIFQATVNSKGLDHWFEVSNFCIDFSLYDPQQQAVKGIYAGKNWHLDQFKKILNEKKQQLDFLNHPFKTLTKGKYRTYFSPSALQTFVSIMSWNGLSQEAYQKGNSAFKKLVEGQNQLSSSFSLYEDFTSNEIPRFNELGEMSPELVKLIDQGKFKSLLCSSRSAREYNIPSNNATFQEGLRSTIVLPGQIDPDHILKELNTGLYVTDLHYLNWSDVQEGRITGMTRFGCFWVENGHFAGPVHNLRFDETLYHFWGAGLIGLTNYLETFPNTNTYVKRELGQTVVPGMLVNDFTYVS